MSDVGRTASPLRVALLRGDDHHNQYLEALLRSRFEVVAVVVEPGRSQRVALRRRGKLKDAVAAEYHKARRDVLGLNRFRRRFYDDAFMDINLARPAPAGTLAVDSINDPTVTKAVVAASPDICVITCTTILSQATIERIGINIINIHGGHLPHYRGCHCFFFALSAGNFDQIGSTIHFVDSGIDTGDIIEVARPAISNADNAESLYCKAERLAAHRLLYWLERLEEGIPLPRQPQSFRGRLCLRRHRRPSHDVMFAWRRWRGQLQFPTVSEGERWERPSIVAAPGPASQRNQ